MPFQKGQSGNPAYKKEEVEEIDKKIEELQSKKELIENKVETEISQFNNLYQYSKSNFDILHERIMRVELWITEITHSAQEASKTPPDVPETLPPIDDNFIKAEKPRGVFSK